MISYELAKRLKDAGFKLKLCANAQDAFLFGMVNIEGVKYIYPTLSELIEACGDKFALLTLDNEENGGKRWEARFGTYKFINNSFWGSTPEEAVANLWLEINNKN